MHDLHVAPESPDPAQLGAQAVADWPPLTSEQRDRIAALLAPASLEAAAR